MRCRLVPEKCVEVGDHVIVVAGVQACGGYERGKGMGLVYAEGGYWKVEAEVDMVQERVTADDRDKGFRRPSLHLSTTKDGSQTTSSDSS